MRPRERYLAIAVGVMLGGWFLDAVALQPAMAWLDRIGEATRAASREAGESQVLVENQKRILADWRGRHAAGLLDDEGAARFRAQQVLAASARASGFGIDSIGGGQLVGATREQSYDLVRLNVSGQGSLAQAQGFIAGIEGAAMPLRIERCEFAATDPRQDRLDVTVMVSTRIVSAAARAGRTVPDGTPPWKPEARDAKLDAAVLEARPFLADRSRPRSAPATKAVVEAKPAAPSGWVLVGIVDREPGAAAFLRELGGGGERILRPGDAFDGATVVAVDGEGLHLLDDDDGVRLITVGSDLAGQSVAPVAVRAVERSGDPAPSAKPTVSAPVPPGASSGTDAERETILQRLRQQRNRNQ